MASQTKMIIITSDEDLIRQFSLNQTNNVQIFDLDRVQPTTSNQNNDNILINLSALTGLSESQSKNDQNSSQASKTSRKSFDITCVVCGDRAIGFNYDALSCGSCKAFFLRNANKSNDRIRCSTGRDQCSIVYTNKRNCTKCRLARCFAVGMRKEFFHTEEQKQKRRKYSKSTSNIEISSPAVNNTDHELNQIEDRTIIENLQSAFISFFQTPKEQISNLFDFTDRSSTLITWSNFVNQIALRYVNFLRRINEFEQLCLNDRIILIKYNVFPIFPISKCYHYNGGYICPYNSREEEEIHQRIFNMLGLSNSISDGFINVVVLLVQVTGQDPKVLSLLLLIFFFTPGLSMSEDEPPLTDPLAVHRAQSHYTKILWNYLSNRYGEIEAGQRLTQFLSLISRMQSGTKDYQKFFREQCTVLNIVEEITPLMQSVLNIS